MPFRVRPWLAGVAIVAVLALVVAALIAVRAWRAGTPLQQAMSLVPDDAARYEWTDWAGVRQELGWKGGPDVSRGDLTRFLDRAWGKDLTASSALADASGITHTGYGFSPADLQWELFSQSTDGQVMLGKLEGDGAVDRVLHRLRRTGLKPPQDGGDVWSATSVDLQGIDPDSTAIEVLANIAVVPDQDLVVLSDSPAYTQRTVDHLGEGQVSDQMDAAAGSLGDALDAQVISDQVACADMSITDASATDSEEAEQLTNDAGEVTAYDALGMAVLPNGRPRDVRFSMVFDDHDEAVTNADSRSVLAAGPAPVQGGSFTDIFRVRKVAADDAVVNMDLRPKSGMQVLEDLSSGSVLFATC